MADEGTLRVEELIAESAWLRRLARSLVGDPHLADDLAQEAMLAALRHPPGPEVRVRAWLTGTLRNLAAAWRRGDANRRHREARAEEGRPPGPRELTEAVELQKLLAEVLLELEEPYRRTVLLRYYRGLSSAEIARRTGTPPGTVRWRLKYGLDELRRRLDERGEGGRESWMAALAPFAGLPAPGSGPPATAVPAAPALAGGSAVRRLGLAAALLLVGLLALVVVGLLPGADRLGDGPDRALAPAAGRLADAPRAPEELASAADRSASGIPEEPTAPPPARVELRARAVDADGVPVEGARLSAPALPGAPFAESGADGRLVLLLPPFSATLELAFVAEGRIPRRLPVTWRGEAPLWLGDLELRRSAAVEGRVLDAAGRPAAGALVLVDRLPGRWERVRQRVLPLREWSYLGSMLPDDAPRALADEEGRYRIEALEERFVLLWARAEGSFAGHSPPIGLVAGGTTHAPDLELVAPRPEEIVRGQVVDPEGQPVAGAAIRAWRATRPELQFAEDWIAYHARADERGRFELPANPNPMLELRARDPSGRWRAAPLERVRAGGPQLVVRLLPPATLDLRVTREDGSVPAELELEVLDARTRRVLDRASEPRIELPSGAFLLRLRSAGCAELELGPLDPGLAGEPLECVLPPAPRCRVRVTAGGRPVEDARVQLLALAADGRWRGFPELTRGPEPLVCSVAAGGLLAELRTDAEGRAELSLERPERFLVRALAPGRAPAVLGPFLPERWVEDEVEREEDELALELGAGGSLAGRVLVDPGLEVAGTLVAATRGDGELRVVRVGPEGAFRMEGLGAGAWQLRALAHDPGPDPGSGLALAAATPGEEPLRGEPRFDVEVREGALVARDLDLRTLASLRLEGEIRLDGEPPGPWRASLHRVGSAGGEEIPTASLDPRGRFRLFAREPGLYELQAWLPHGDGAQVVLRDLVELRPGGASWSVALDTALLRPAPGALLEEHPDRLQFVWRGEGELACAVRLRNGEIEGGLELRVPAGPGWIVACAEEDDPFAASALVELELAPGETRALPLD